MVAVTTFAVLAAILALSGGGAGEPAQASTAHVAAPLGEIVYVRRTGSTRGDIFATSVDGRRRRRLTRTPQLEQDLAVSPDGRRIAFTLGEPGITGGVFRHSGIWVLDTEGRQARQLTSGASDHDPAWTKDGTHLLFARAVEAPRRGDSPADAIISARLADAVTRMLVRPRFGDEDGTCENGLTRWPGRDLVIFVHVTACLRDHGGHPIEAVDTRGKVTTVLDWLSNFAFLYRLEFSPDGKMLAFYGLEDINGGNTAYVSTASGTRRRQVRFFHGPPSWSSDGAWLAGIHNGDVWIARPDGSEASRVTRTPEKEESPAWIR
jgi:WD40 repeat protein